MAVTGEKSRGRAPRRAYVCPDCGVSFMGWNERSGKRCPNGHWRSMYHLDLYAKNGVLPVPRVRVPMGVRRVVGPPKPPALAMADLGFERRSEQCELALQMWLMAYDRLIEQMPANVSRLLVQGALDRTAAISRQLVL